MPTETDYGHGKQRAAFRNSLRLTKQTYKRKLVPSVSFEPLRGQYLFYAPPTRWQRVKRWFKDQLRKVGILPKLREVKT